MRVVRLAIEPSLIVAVTTPKVLLSNVLASATVALPLVTLTATADQVSIVEAVIAVAIAEALPVRVATPSAFTLTVVKPSRVLSASALTELSVTVNV